MALEGPGTSLVPKPIWNQIPRNVASQKWGKLTGNPCFLQEDGFRLSEVRF